MSENPSVAKAIQAIANFKARVNWDTWHGPKNAAIQNQWLGRFNSLKSIDPDILEKIKWNYIVRNTNFVTILVETTTSDNSFIQEVIDFLELQQVVVANKKANSFEIRI